MLPIVLIHGYSSEGADTTAAAIYGDLPKRLRLAFGDDAVVEVNLSRWISLSDGVSIDDISFAMNRALKSTRFQSLLSTGFNAIIHSTGALVVRNWVKSYGGKPCPLHNLVHLAGANFGSGLAHIGKGQAARWGRLIFQGVGRGVRVLHELEFGALKTLDMHMHFLSAGNDMYDDYQVQEFCIVGSQTLGFLRAVPIRYVKEDSADNTVRTSAGNLNFNYLQVAPTDEAKALSVAQLRKLMRERLAVEQLLRAEPLRPGGSATACSLRDRVVMGNVNNRPLSSNYYAPNLSGLAEARRPVPYAIAFETAHFGADIGIVMGTKNRKPIIALIAKALSTPYDPGEYGKVAAEFDKVTERTFRRAAKLKGGLTEWNKQEQYEGHAQLIFRLRDQYGEEVTDYDITFRSTRSGSANRIERMIEDKHVNTKNPSRLLKNPGDRAVF